ncbi:MAG: T9SS type A sorting domain-containing protein, partial [Candidatus Kapaibacteriota bacterium]
RGNSYEMIAPAIQSDECKFRVTSTDGKIIAESELFKIGNPTGSIIFPKGGEVLCANSTYAVKWNASYVNKIILEYSTDNGASWRKVSLGSLGAKTGSYLWRVPSRISSECLIRIRPTFNENEIARSDSLFSIDSCQTIGGVISENSNSKDYIRNIEYIPDDNELVLEFGNLEELKNPKLVIYDLLGQVIYSEKIYYNINSNNRKSIKISSTSQGILFVILNFEGGSKFVTTVIVR